MPAMWYEDATGALHQHGALSKATAQSAFPPMRGSAKPVIHCAFYGPAKPAAGVQYSERISARRSAGLQHFIVIDPN
jgi:hypothetical protein